MRETYDNLLSCEQNERCRKEREERFKDLSKLNPKEELVKKSLKCIGKTYDVKEAGYILEDGSYLDFSGKRFGGTPGERVIDHREIGGSDECRVIETGKKGLSGDDAMEFFEEKANAIRFHYSPARVGREESSDMNISLNLFQKPTKEQVKSLKRITEFRRPTSIYVDVYDDCGRRVVAEGIENATPLTVDQFKEKFNELRYKSCYKTEKRGIEI